MNVSYIYNAGKPVSSVLYVLVTCILTIEVYTVLWNKRVLI